MQRSTACSANSLQRPYIMLFIRNFLLNSSEVKLSAVPYRDAYRIVTLLVIHHPSGIVQIFPHRDVDMWGRV